MILQKVIIDNIRSHQHFVFEPELVGTTAISGENGAGKSTIVDAFAWSLFGTRVNALKNKDYIREGVSPKDSLVQVQSFFIVGNREYKVERKIINDSGTTECNVYSRELNSGNVYSFDCGPSITHSEEFIRNVLGCDEKGFLSSVFIQQKQVDQIVSAGPKERGAVIEKLIGISAITQAMNLAREESKALQKAAQIIQKTGSLKEEERKVAEQKKLVQQLNKEIEQSLKNQQTIQSQLREVENTYNIEKERQEEANQLLVDIEISKNTVKTLQSQLTTQLDLHQKISKEINKKNKLVDTTEIEKRVNEITQQKNELVKSNVESEIIINKYKELKKNKIPKNIESILEKAETIQNEYEKNLRDFEREELLTSESIKNNKKMLTKMIKGDSYCPLCGSEIELNEKRIKDQEQLINELSDKKNQLKANIEQLKTSINNGIQHIIEIKEQINIKQEIIRLESEYKKALFTFETNNTSIKAIDSELKILNKQIEEVGFIKQNIENSEHIKKSIDELNENIRIENEKIKRFEERLLNINPISSKDFKALTKHYEQMKKDFTDIGVHISKLEVQLEQAKIRGRDLLDSYKKFKQAMIEFNQLTTQIQISNSSEKSLLDFKKQRVTTSTPRLTMIASDILSKFTNGDFVELKLSENFEASVVTKYNKERPVSKLSGGELSTVAIALRLAIALFLHEGVQSLLVLDEVLVSMSQERSQLILETITSLTQAQIIIIAHSDVINSFADKVIQI